MKVCVCMLSVWLCIRGVQNRDVGQKTNSSEKSSQSSEFVPCRDQKYFQRDKMIIRVEDKEKMGDKRFEVIRGEMIGFTG